MKSRSEVITPTPLSNTVKEPEHTRELQNVSASYCDDRLSAGSKYPDCRRPGHPLRSGGKTQNYFQSLQQGI